VARQIVRTRVFFTIIAYRSIRSGWTSPLSIDRCFGTWEVDMVAAEQGSLVLRFEDQLTVAHAQEAHARISSALANHASVIIDVSNPQDIDLTFLQILIAANKTAKANGRQLLINAPADGMLADKLKAAGLPVEHLAAHETAIASTEAVGLTVAGQASTEGETRLPDLDTSAFASLIKEIGAPAVSTSLDIFFAEMQDRISSLKTLSIKDELPAVLREAHSLRGTAGAFGLRRLGEDAAELERNAAKMDEHAYRGLIERIEAAFARGRAALQTASLAA
jgi:HPt (histidine-containing phosphotransfer) domain-containing protein/anti-anti-sigma regulatory factor